MKLYSCAWVLWVMTVVSYTPSLQVTYTPHDAFSSKEKCDEVLKDFAKAQKSWLDQMITNALAAGGRVSSEFFRKNPIVCLPSPIDPRTS